MPDAFLPAHGGDLIAAAARYGGTPDEYLDFSANIDPLGPPPSVVRALQDQALALSSAARYPDPRHAALREAIAQQSGADPAEIVIANGSAALLDIAIRALRAKTCLLPVPAFSEYARALRAARCTIVTHALERERNFALDVEALAIAMEEARADLAIVNNPHNPTGGLTAGEALAALVERAAARRAFVIVDEAFIDYAPDASLARLAPRAERLIVLRSLTKFYAMPGLRVGYAIANKRLARLMSLQVPSWPVSTLAAEAARLALEESEHAQRVRAQNERARAALRGALVTAGAAVYPSAANFLLLSTAVPSPALTRALAERERILVRDCSTFAGLERGGFLRVAVRRPVENERLAAALARCAAQLARPIP